MSINKTCNKCNKSKDITEFNKRKSSKDGYRTQCRNCENEYSRQWKKENPEKHRKFNLDSYKRLSQSSEWLENKAEYWKEKRKLNKERYNQYVKNYVNRVKDTPEYKLRMIASNLLRRLIKSAGTSKLDYTTEQLKNRIEFNFKSGMSWDNYGEWNVDHKKPVKRFLNQGCKNIKTINMLCNLQPLWASENFKKSDKFTLCKKSK